MSTRTKSCSARSNCSSRASRHPLSRFTSTRARRAGRAARFVVARFSTSNRSSAVPVALEFITKSMAAAMLQPNRAGPIRSSAVFASTPRRFRASRCGAPRKRILASPFLRCLSPNNHGHSQLRTCPETVDHGSCEPTALAAGLLSLKLDAFRPEASAYGSHFKTLS